MVGAAGLEPATLGLEIRCSIHLSYAPAAINLAHPQGPPEPWPASTFRTPGRIWTHTLHLSISWNRVIREGMSSAIPILPPPPERRAQSSQSSQSRHRRGFLYKLRRKRDLRRMLSTATLWVVTVVAVWIVLKQIIK